MARSSNREDQFSALRGIEADFGPEHAGTFRGDLHPEALPPSSFIQPCSPLAPHGMAGFILANGSMSSNQSGEGTIRQALIEADLVDCMVALPGTPK